MKKKSCLLKTLTDDEVGEIHSATLEVLERTGVRVQEESVLERLHEVGAKVDFNNQLVRFPPALLEALVKKAPTSFTWHARDPEKSMQMGAGHTYFGTQAMATIVIDLDGDRRPATCQDADNISRILDGLEYVHDGTAGVLPQDVPLESAHAYNMFYTIKNSSKPFRGRGHGREQAGDCIDMAAVVAGGREELSKRPMMAAVINPISPLTHSRELLEAMIDYATLGLPVIISPMVQAGATGPITLAGTMVQHNAEVLSGVAITQAFKPGAPVVYGGIPGILDMRTGTFAYGAIERTLLQVGLAQLAHFYQLPCRADCGATDSKVLDMQAGFESTQATLLAALSGYDYLVGAVYGRLQTPTVVVSYEKLLIDHEIAGNISRFLQGISVQPDTLAVDLIDRVGPGGHYLDQKHTMKYLQAEHFLSELASREGYLKWKEEGERTMRDRAREKAKHILDTHSVRPLDEGMERELKEIVKSIDARAQSSR